VFFEALVRDWDVTTGQQMIVAHMVAAGVAHFSPGLKDLDDQVQFEVDSIINQDKYKNVPNFLGIASAWPTDMRITHDNQFSVDSPRATSAFWPDGSKYVQLNVRVYTAGAVITRIGYRVDYYVWPVAPLAPS
jgi:hypothetical protein